MLGAADVEAWEDLHDAILSITSDRLRTVFTEICLEEPTAFKAAYQRLLVDVGGNLDVGDKEDDESASEAEVESVQPHRVMQAPPGTKRKRYEICDQCDKEYDVVANTKNSCVYHTGELEVDDDGDVWADHDENIHGTIDSDEMRKEVPEGFKWECCNGLGDKTGCKRGPHRPKEAKRRKVY